MGKMLNVPELSEKLHVHQNTARAMLKRGDIPSIRVGNRFFRVREEDVDAFMAGAATADPADDTSAIERLAELLRESPTWLFDRSEPVPAGMEPLHGVLAGALSGGAA